LDPGLIRRAQDGDVESFTALITGRIAPLTRTAMAILGHEADARDAVAETVATVWRELPRLRSGVALAPSEIEVVVELATMRLEARADQDEPVGFEQLAEVDVGQRPRV